MRDRSQELARAVRRSRRLRRAALVALSVATLVIAAALVALFVEQRRQAEQIAQIQQYNADLAAWRRSMEAWEGEKAKEARARDDLLTTLRGMREDLRLIRNELGVEP